MTSKTSHQIRLHEAELVPVWQACIEFDRLGIMRGRGRRTVPHDVIHAMLAERDCVLLEPGEQPMTDHERARIRSVFHSLAGKIRAGILTVDAEIPFEPRLLAPDPLWREQARTDGRPKGDPSLDGGEGS
jgi:hypothetical protein